MNAGSDSDRDNLNMRIDFDNKTILTYLHWTNMSEQIHELVAVDSSAIMLTYQFPNSQHKST